MSEAPHVSCVERRYSSVSVLISKAGGLGGGAAWG